MESVGIIVHARSAAMFAVLTFALLEYSELWEENAGDLRSQSDSRWKRQGYD